MSGNKINNINKHTNISSRFRWPDRCSNTDGRLPGTLDTGSDAIVSRLDTDQRTLFPDHNSPFGFNSMGEIPLIAIISKYLISISTSHKQIGAISGSYISGLILYYLNGDWTIIFYTFGAVAVVWFIIYVCNIPL